VENEPWQTSRVGARIRDGGHDSEVQTRGSTGSVSYCVCGVGEENLPRRVERLFELRHAKLRARNGARPGANRRRRRRAVRRRWSTKAEGARTGRPCVPRKQNPIARRRKSRRRRLRSNAFLTDDSHGNLERARVRRRRMRCPRRQLRCRERGGRSSARARAREHTDPTPARALPTNSRPARPCVTTFSHHARVRALQFACPCARYYSTTMPTLSTQPTPARQDCSRSHSPDTPAHCSASDPRRITPSLPGSSDSTRRLAAAFSYPTAASANTRGLRA
jgi:hypothetical protein